MRQSQKGAPRTIRLDKSLEKEIRMLLQESGMDGFSQFARYLFRLGVAEESRRREQLALIQKQPPIPREAQENTRRALEKERREWEPVCT
jgi:hypothetical protein